MTKFATKAPDPVGGDYLDARPIVASRRRPTSPWLFALGLTAAAFLLFLLLNNARQSRQAEAERSSGSGLVADAVPDLVVPPDYSRTPVVVPERRWATPYNRPEPVFVAPTARTAKSARSVQPRASQTTSIASAAPPAYSPAATTDVPPPPLAVPQQRSAELGSDGAAASSGPVTAARTINPSTTMLQGSTIPAVLESALDSTTPGQVRAMVTRDAWSTDGSHILVPRGSRLYGTYEANLTQGQKRLQVRWSRLVRPDMVSIALDSPAADTLGRAGVSGKVNSHFLQKLGNALLSSTVSLGGLIASRRDVPVVVAVPSGAVPQVSQTLRGGAGEIRPTLSVRQGTRITVFVQHDLDFSGVENGQ